MIQTPDWQKLSCGCKRVFSYIKKLFFRAKEYLLGLLKNAPDWKILLKICLPYVLVAVLASAMTLGVMAVRENITANQNPTISVEEILALQENKKELEQALVKTELLLNQLTANNENMRVLLEEAKREEKEMAEVIKNLQDAYNMQNQKWFVPIKYTALTSPFGLRQHPVEGQTKFHYGVDLAAPVGTPIVASRGGTVKIATYDESSGNFVEIDHLDGYTSRYLHMTRYIVSAGQIVIPGQVIGYCGATGKVTGSHLHFSIYLDGNAVDPANYMDL